MMSRLTELVEPFDPERIVNCSYELSMGSEAYITGRDSRTKMALTRGEQLSVPPGQFAQLLTEETVEIPEDALGLISIKSGLKSRGLVNVSGFHVDPGYRGDSCSQSIMLAPTILCCLERHPRFWFGTLISMRQHLISIRERGPVCSQYPIKK